jgi:4-diphosphocytidyl-2-C-methyl-D-erythritol kinase
MKLTAYAKINLALVVGDRRDDGLHEIASVLQRVGLADTVELEDGPELEIEGFTEDTLVRTALERLAEASNVEPRWRVRIEKRIPVAAGLGGGSADAAAALTLANERLMSPELHELAASVGADVPYFLEPGPKLAQGAGELLRPVDLPQDYAVLLAIPDGERKESTAEVYRRFEERHGGRGFADRRRVLLEALARCDIGGLPPNDLASSPLAEKLRELGAFRADVTGAGPAVYGLFEAPAAANEAARSLCGAEVWVTKPVW